MGEWLVAVVLFWAVAALYFGGMERDVEGGTGFRQFIGLMLTYAIFLVVWAVVRRTVAPESAVGVIVASAVAALLLPIWARVGFMAVGARLRVRHEAH